MKKIFYCLPVFIFVSCAKEPVQDTKKVTTSAKYYTVIFQNQKYTDLRKVYGTEGGFYMKSGRYICFNGNYIYYEQFEGENNAGSN